MGTTQKDGSYIGPAMEHYICHKTYILKTRVERISGTIEFSPKQFKIPQMYFTDATTHAT